MHSYFWYRLSVDCTLCADDPGAFLPGFNESPTVLKISGAGPVNPIYISSIRINPPLFVLFINTNIVGAPISVHNALWEDIINYLENNAQEE